VKTSRGTEPAACKEKRLDTHLRWTADLGGRQKTWNAEITEQIPDERIAWRSIEGAPNAGVVTFHRLDPRKTRIMLQMEYEPETIVEHLGDWIGLATTRIKGDLDRFKRFIEERGHETRGTVDRPHP
jgi:uncharacterized membrane protein